jgi:hypothetical protein
MIPRYARAVCLSPGLLQKLVGTFTSMTTCTPRNHVSSGSMQSLQYLRYYVVVKISGAHRVTEGCSLALLENRNVGLVGALDPLHPLVSDRWNKDATQPTRRISASH